MITFDGNEVIKGLHKFGDHNSTPELFGEFIRENTYFGCKRPSSYYSAFHEQFTSPRVTLTTNNLFAPQAYYGWQDALSLGKHLGRWRKYDLNQAYLWSSTQGLPDMRTIQSSDFIGNYPGLYHVRLREVNERAPYPYNSYFDVNASTEEIDAYGLRVDQIYGGIIWQEIVDPDAILNVVRQFSFSKQMSKGFWGRWASTRPVQCTVHSGKTWDLANNKLNLVWAHMIVARVKLRLWNAVRVHGAAHVYVDSIITKGELPVGTGLGEWKLEKDYRDGVYIGRPGWYGESETNLDAHSGVHFNVEEFAA